MPRRPFMISLLWAQRHKEVDDLAREAKQHAREKRDENSARLRLCETRKRLGGWSS